MQIDLTQEEINLIASLIGSSNLTMNRESMIAYVNLTGAILQKFQTAVKPAETRETADGQTA